LLCSGIPPVIRIIGIFLKAGLVWTNSAKELPFNPGMFKSAMRISGRGNKENRNMLAIQECIDNKGKGKVKMVDDVFS